MLLLKRKPLSLPAWPVAFTENGTAKLADRLVRWALFNLLVVAALGVLMRALPLVPHFPLLYKNVLHGHSHFAFGGWIMPVLLALMLKIFPELAGKVAYRHWRNIGVLLMASAYGMLLAFPLQGYKPVSIFFSTLSVLAGYYLAWVVWAALRQLPQAASHRFLKAGLFYMVLASLGPFATGPLVVLGYAETPLYYNAIYGYLHFTYNGWFTFAVLAFLYRRLEDAGPAAHGQKAYHLLNLACIPAYALSLLWNKPGLFFNIVGGVAGLLQLVATAYLFKDAFPLRWAGKKVRWMVLVALCALVLKHLLQAASALPLVAEMAALGRSFVIAYLHLVLILFVSLFALAQLVHYRMLPFGPSFRTGIGIFLAGFTGTELLLVGAGFHYIVRFYVPLLLVLALLMLAGLALVYGAGGKKRYLHY